MIAAVRQTGLRAVSHAYLHCHSNRGLSHQHNTLVEEDEVGVFRPRADVQVDEPVDDVKYNEDHREYDARISVDGAR